MPFGGFLLLGAMAGVLKVILRGLSSRGIYAGAEKALEMAPEDRLERLEKTRRLLIADVNAAESAAAETEAETKDEDEDISDVDFIEAMACPGGCVGGTLNVENTFIARSVVKRIIKENNNAVLGDEILKTPGFDLSWTKEIYSKPSMKLDEDIKIAIKKMEKLDIIHKEFPGLDCSSCGAPTCRALAEDIVRGFAERSDCIFILKDEIRKLVKLYRGEK
jgi:hypothetical protein